MRQSLRFCFATLGFAVAAISIPSHVTPPANAWEELKVDSDAPVLEVNSGRSTVIALDLPFATIAVADPEIASVTATSNKSFFVRGKAPGWTTVLVYDETGSVMELIQVNVALGLDALRSDLSTLLPDEDFQVLPVSDGVLISGDISTAGAAAKAVQLAERHVPGGVANGLAVEQAQQVMLEVRFIEASRAVVREFGIGFEANQPGDFAFATSSSLVSGILPQAAAVAQKTFSGGFSIDATINALESKDVLRTLARPNLVALSGDTASFLAGGEFPIPVGQNEDVVTIEFREFGVSLAFTPTVLGEDMINIKVRPEVSTIDNTNAVSFGGIEIPGLSVRRTETTVELRDGQAFAIAGLLQNSYTNDAANTPWLSSVPVLGALFSSKRFERSETELVIIITPRLVQPAASVADIATPHDYFDEPEEKDFFLLDQTVALHENSEY